MYTSYPNKIIKRALESLDTNLIGFTQNKHFLILQTRLLIDFSIITKIITEIKILTSFLYEFINSSGLKAEEVIKIDIQEFLLNELYAIHLHRMTL
jgi:hypothetical protein